MKVISNWEKPGEHKGRREKDEREGGKETEGTGKNERRHARFASVKCIDDL